VTAPWVPLLLLASTGATQAAPNLAVAAAASGRPPECRQDVASAKGPSVWAIAREPALRPYCDLVAKAHALLASDPRGSEKAAEDAETVLPGQAAPTLVRARAALALGRLEDAERYFGAAAALDPRGIEDPATLHDYARVLKRRGRVVDALAIYRRLVPRASLLANPDREVAVLLEAAHVAMAAPPPTTPPGSDGTSVGGLEEAAAYLREARARPATQYKGDVSWSLALVVDRTGQKENADALVSEARRSGARLHPAGIDYVASEGDLDALAALAKESDEPANAAAHWTAFLAGPGGKGPWAKVASLRLEALRKTPRGRP
jgi:tetratricopeptide (TPR) repeat protein